MYDSHKPQHSLNIKIVMNDANTFREMFSGNDFYLYCT